MQAKDESPLKEDTELDVVDENDTVIGRALRSEIHDKGFYHREVHVWFVTPAQEIIFQKRALDKDTFPGLLDATVGGHVELGESYDDAALKEITEETGLEIIAADILFLCKIKSNAFDPVTHRHNNCHRVVYGHVFCGNIQDLKIECGHGDGFVRVPLRDVSSFSKIIPGLLDEQYMAIYKSLGNLVLKP